jgi:hypothetical protein
MNFYVNYVAFTTIEELIGRFCESFDSNKDTTGLNKRVFEGSSCFEGLFG